MKQHSRTTLTWRGCYLCLNSICTKPVTCSKSLKVPFCCNGSHMTIPNLFFPHLWVSKQCIFLSPFRKQQPIACISGPVDHHVCHQMLMVFYHSLCNIAKPANTFSYIAYFLQNINPCSPEGFPQTYFLKGGCFNPPWIINTEGHITLNLLPVYRYGHRLSIDIKISTNH